MSDPELVDSFGKLDILEDGEEWANLFVELKERRQEIVGVDLNTVLFGVFRLIGKVEIRKEDFPCDVRAWESIVEAIFVYLAQIVPMNDLLIRVVILLRNIEPQTEEITVGALDFLRFWIGQYGAYLHSQHFLTIHSFAKSERLVLSNHLARTWDTKNVPQYYKRIINKLNDLVDLSDNAIEDDSSQQMHWDFSLAAPQGGPQLWHTEGQWDGQIKAEIKEQLKKTLQEGPKIKLEIFGGEALLDSSDSDSDSDNAAITATNADVMNDLDQLQPGHQLLQQPQIRIGPGTSLVQSARSLRTQQLLDMDLLELARQWTLCDHALFVRLRLHSILRVALGAKDDPYVLNRLHLDSMEFAGVKRFVDRFNSASLWVTHTVLQGDSPNQRGYLLTRFIELALALQQLGNFHGLMIVLTALQQGCIARLAVSWEKVSRPAMVTLSQLKMLMAAGKNYSRYRSELQRRAAEVPLEVYHQRRERYRQLHHSQRRAAPAGDAVVMDWRVDVERKLQSFPSSGATVAGGGAYMSAPPTPSAPASASPVRSRAGMERLPSQFFGGNSSAGAAADEGGAVDSPVSDDFDYEAGVEAIVPHLAAHVAALSGIAEVHSSEYLSDHAHLFSVAKWKLCQSLLRPLEQWQAVSYPFAAVRRVQTALHRQWRRHLHRNATNANTAAAKLFQLSEARESADMIRRALQQQQQQQQQQHPGSPANKKKTVTIGGASSSSGKNNKSAAAAASSAAASPRRAGDKGAKFQKSDAYDRIRRSSASFSRTDSGTLIEDAPRSNNNSRPGLQRQPSRLQRMLSSVFTVKQSQDDEDEDEDEEDDDNDAADADEAETEREQDEDDEDEDEDDEPKKKKTLKPLKSLLRAISFKK